MTIFQLCDIHQVVDWSYDELSHIPLFEKCVSVHTSDKTSFKDGIITYRSLIKEQFKNLRYLVADSALCTSDNAKELALHRLEP